MTLLLLAAGWVAVVAAVLLPSERAGVVAALVAAAMFGCATFNALT